MRKRRKITLKEHLKSLPNELSVNLEKEFQKIHQQYFLEKWEPSQLNGGRFAEVILRIIEFKDKGTYSPIGSQLARISLVNSARQNTNLPESIRFQILSLSELLLDFRNKRNVGHLGLINPNEMDATFVLHAANWIMSELIRIETKIEPEEAQKEIEKIIERKVPIVEEIGGRLKSLDPKLTVKNKVLVFCYQKYPEQLTDDQLFLWTKDKNKARFKSYLLFLDKISLIDYCGNKVQLTKRGLLWVEKNIKFELEI